MQRRRVHTGTDQIAVSQFTIVATIDESNGVNAHGFRASFIVEPEVADANANGNWVLYCLPDETSAQPGSTTAVLELEGSNAFIWALGTWAASNQTPYCKDIEIGTSRNCQQGARLLLVVQQEGITSGQSRVRSLMTFHTKSL